VWRRILFYHFVRRSLTFSPFDLTYQL